MFTAQNRHEVRAVAVSAQGVIAAAWMENGKAGIELRDQQCRFSQNIDTGTWSAVELAYFGGMSQDEIATVLGVPAETVDRDLRFARAWLNRTLAG